jgi:NADH-quinone oxidoreductase subunit N
MTSIDFLCLAPMMITAASLVLMMLVIAMKRNYQVTFGIALAFFIAAFVSLFYVVPSVPRVISHIFIIDGFTILVFGVIMISSLLMMLMSYRYMLYAETEKEEFFIMFLTAVLGSLILSASCSFITLFLGIEMLSISLYALIAYKRSHRDSIEAAVKYLVLASVSSAFLLFGMGLIYLDTGSLEFSRIAEILSSHAAPSNVLMAGFGMMVVGIGFKLSLAPFHMWTPDVYEGAPAPVTAFVATVSKGAVMTVMLRFFYNISGFSNSMFVIIISVIAVLTMFVGNFLALRQQNLKRILACSSIANMG